MVKMFGPKASNTRLVLILCFSDCAMPCHDSEEEMNARDDDQPRTPTKPTGNGRAGRVDPDGENDSDEQDSDDELDAPSAKAKRKWNGKANYRLIKQWVTGEEAELESEDIDRKLFELAREYMSASKLK